MIFVFQKSPALTAFWTFIESSRYITGLVIFWTVFQFILFIFLLRYIKRIFSVKNLIFKRNIFGGTPTFQKFYFRSNTKFSNQIFSVKHQVFKPNIFGGTPTFQKFYFRPNTKFSNEIFSATQGLFILLHLFEPRRFGNKQFLLYYSIYLAWRTSWVFLILYSCL